MRVCSATTAVTSGHGIIFNTLGFSISVWAEIVWDIVVGSLICYLTRYHEIFRKLFYGSY
jgi:hypothetical protein